MEGGGPDPAFCAQVGERQRFLRLGEHRGDALIERGRRGGDGLGALDHLQGEGQALLRQLDDERPRRGSGASSTVNDSSSQSRRR